MTKPFPCAICGKPPVVSDDGLSIVCEGHFDVLATTPEDAMDEWNILQETEIDRRR